jgi:hypothetical protein
MTDNQTDEMEDKPPISPMNMNREHSCFSTELSKIEEVSKYLDKRHTSKATNYHEPIEAYAHEGNTHNLVKPFLDML